MINASAEISDVIEATATIVGTISATAAVESTEAALSEAANVTVTDADNASSPISVSPGGTYTCTAINRIDLTLRASAGDVMTITIDSTMAATYDLDNPTLTNVASITYIKKNGISVSGNTAFANGDTLEISINRTNSANDSRVVFTEA